MSSISVWQLGDSTSLYHWSIQERLGRLRMELTTVYLYMAYLG